MQRSKGTAKSTSANIYTNIDWRQYFPPTTDASNFTTALGGFLPRTNTARRKVLFQENVTQC